MKEPTDLDGLVDFRAVLAVLFHAGDDLVGDDAVALVEFLVDAAQGADDHLVDLVDGGLQFGGRHLLHLVAAEHPRLDGVVEEPVWISHKRRRHGGRWLEGVERRNNNERANKSRYGARGGRRKPWAGASVRSVALETCGTLSSAFESQAGYGRRLGKDNFGASRRADPTEATTHRRAPRMPSGGMQRHIIE